MIITESFLRHNTPGNTGAVCPNKAQVEILGLNYPLKTGWVNQLIGKTLTKSQVIHFKSLNVTKKMTTRQRQKQHFINMKKLEKKNGNRKQSKKLQTKTKSKAATKTAKQN